MKFKFVPSAVVPTVSGIKSSSAKMLPYWIAASATALFSVFYASIFRWSERLSYEWVQTSAGWAFVITPIAMLGSTLMAHFFAPAATGSGIPQLLAAVEVSHSPSPLLKKLLSIRVIITKFLGSCLCVAGGGITGREGPMLQIAASIFLLVQNAWKKYFPKLPLPNLQSMILAGGAAGLASAFNTPLGGVIFAVEELAKVHISQVRTYVFHAVIMAGLLAQMFMGNYLYFGKISLSVSPSLEFVALIFGMVVIGALGALFGKAIVWLLDLRQQQSFAEKIVSTLVFGILVATMTYFFHAPAIGSGREVIVDILKNQDHAAPYYLGFLRLFANLFTYAGGVIGGVFAPALSTGAAFGSWMSDFSPGFNHQLWALAGMAAFLTGVTRTPFTSLILVLEMTDTHDVIIYLMLAAMVAQGVAKYIDPISFYEHMSYRLIHSRSPNSKEF